jgi:hypothetical protein
MSQRAKKKVMKEVRSAQTGALPLLEKPQMKELLKKYPGKKPELSSSLKRMEARKKKRTAKKSRRTTPGDPLTQDSAPRITHLEGQRWIKTLEKQNIVQASMFQRKSMKKK